MDRARISIVLADLSVVAVTGCGGRAGQSALEPAGPAAASIAWLYWVMCAAFTAVFLLVLGLLALALYRRPTRATTNDAQDSDDPVPPLGPTGFIVAGGIVLPIIVVVPLLFLSLDASAFLNPPPQDALTIRVVGHMWWWEIVYPEEGIVTANEIHIPVGKPVRLELVSADVIHSFWVPRLNGKRDLIPGITNVFWIEANEAGVYRGQCGEYCGRQHANMILFVVAVPQNEFQTWANGKRATAAAMKPADLAQGAEVFRTAGCADCHTVRGTSAAGKIGPDLTHFGSRLTIAGMLDNTRGNLAGWIGDPQAIKPGVRMPRSYLRPDELMVVTRYLESLQ